MFAGGWSLEAAETVCAGDVIEREAVVELLGRLLDRSLVAAEYAIDGSVRYRMLDTVREYAHVRLVERSELDAVQRRHAAYFCELAERADPELFGTDQVAWFERMRLELGNVRATLEWSMSPTGDLELGLRTAAALFWLWSRVGHLREARAYLSRLLGRYAHPTRARAWALHAAANTAWFDGDLETSRTYLKEAGELAELLGYGRAGVWISIGWASVTLAMGDLEAAERFLQHGLELASVTADLDPGAMHVLLFTFGEAARAQGDLPRARRYLEEALASIHGDTQVYANAFIRSSLGHVALLSGDAAEAASQQLESLTCRSAVHDTQGVSNCLDELGLVAVAVGELTLAARLFAAASALLTVGGGARWPMALAECERAIGQVRSGLGEVAFEAAWQAGQSLTVDQAVAEAAALVAVPGASARQARPGLTAPGSTMNRLTAREREVAVLLARGLRNREIADALVIEERTAANHVEHILNKLGFHSRAQVAAWAAEQQVRAGQNGARAK